MSKCNTVPGLVSGGKVTSPQRSERLRSRKVWTASLCRHTSDWEGGRPTTFAATVQASADRRFRFRLYARVGRSYPRAVHSQELHSRVATLQVQAEDEAAYCADDETGDGFSGEADCSLASRAAIRPAPIGKRPRRVPTAISRTSDRRSWRRSMKLPACCR
jgi:hypothetical protein